jgi:hypothetical protein
MGGRHTVLARIVEFAEEHKNDQDAVKAFARLELNRMERGVPYLDVIYAAAPLIGLTGTVVGLLKVFSQISPDTGLPDPVAFTQGVALALSATVMVFASRSRRWWERLSATEDRKLRGAARRIARANPPADAAMSLLQNKRRKRPELNLVPLIDVLVMLIFFAFVTMQFKSAATLNITLPKVETQVKTSFAAT